MTERAARVTNPNDSWYPLIAAQIARLARPDDWRLSAPATSWWIAAQHVQAGQQTQGWKLHLSASVVSARPMLERALPVLLSESASFKVAASLQRLHTLNIGLGGYSQIGKFITIYPNDTAQAVRLAAQLDRLTRDLRGPAIPSDRPLTPGSSVYYRYGAFRAQWVQTERGRQQPAITAPDGTLAPDPRETGYALPAWTTDPFIAAGVATELPEPGPLLAQRYLVIELLEQGPSGAVARALDLQAGRRVVLKRAARAAGMALDGRDARDRLRYEAALLARLAGNPYVPAALDLIAIGDDLCLALEEIAGQTLAQRIKTQAARGVLPTGREVVAWGCKLALAIESLHEQSIVHRDLKSTNVIVTPQDDLRLIDFETAYDLQTSDRPSELATRGYQSPEQRAGGAPSVGDDIYSIGALLYLLATGAEPGFAPQPDDLLSRPIRLLNPAIAPALERIIARCLAPQAERFATVGMLRAALGRVAAHAERPAPQFGGEHPHSAIIERQSHYRNLARQLSDGLCTHLQRALHTADPEHGLVAADSSGASTHLYDGSSGQIFALAALVTAFDQPEQRATLQAAAKRLHATPPPAGQVVTGLYIGEAGRAAALLRAGQALADQTLLDAAAQRGQALAAQPYRSPALLDGAAGRLRLHLWLAAALNDHRQLEHAIAAGEALLRGAESDGLDGLCWRLPAGGQRLAGKALCSYSLGSAGIADALLDLAAATGDERYLAAARSASRWLARLATPALADGSALTWPEYADSALAPCTWQHGASGIARFFVHASAFDVAGAAEIAARAARLAARGARWAGPAQAHGLAGNIELLLDMAQTLGDPAYLAEAETLARLLETFLVEQPPDAAYAAEPRITLAPGYMTGAAGIALCLLRLSSPLSQPDHARPVAQDAWLDLAPTA
jgi:serine/threonine protein kinase